MNRLFMLLVIACAACSGPPDDSDTQAPGTDADTEPATEPDTEPDPQLVGDPWSGVCTGNGYFSPNGGGTTVGQFEYFDGPAVAGVEDGLSTGRATCVTGDQSCTAEWVDQPLDGAWTVSLACIGAEPQDAVFELNEESELPNARSTSTPFETENLSVTANLTLSLEPEE